jgi:hypothetical protein
MRTASSPPTIDDDSLPGHGDGTAPAGKHAASTGTSGRRIVAVHHRHASGVGEDPRGSGFDSSTGVGDNCSLAAKTHNSPVTLAPLRASAFKNGL